MMNIFFPPVLKVSIACILLASCATVDNSVEDHAAEVPPVTNNKMEAAGLSAAEQQTQLKTAQPRHWLQEIEKRQQIRSWEIRGRLGVQTYNDGGVLDIIWKQSADEYSIRLIAPLGAGSYHIQGMGDYAEIRYPDGTKKQIDNYDKVFNATLEVDLPSSAIKDWVRGLPASALAVDDIQWNEQGLIESLQQSGWTVILEKYAGKKIKLPHAIYITRDDDEELDIRLLLRQWLLDD